MRLETLFLSACFVAFMVMIYGFGLMEMIALSLK
jgi:hypothetical protein